MDIDPNNPERIKHSIDMSPEDYQRIDQLAEQMLGGLSFDTVYELAKRFHVHLVTMMFCTDSESYEELQSFYKDNPDSDTTRMVLDKFDSMVGYSETKIDDIEPEDSADPIELPDQEFFRNLGLS